MKAGESNEVVKARKPSKQGNTKNCRKVKAMERQGNSEQETVTESKQGNSESWGKPGICDSWGELGSSESWGNNESRETMKVGKK